jgi:hypothetical protein
VHHAVVRRTSLSGGGRKRRTSLGDAEPARGDARARGAAGAGTPFYFKWGTANRRIKDLVGGTIWPYLGMYACDMADMLASKCSDCFFHY